MKRKDRIDNKILRDINNAGRSFLGLYTMYVLKKIEEGFSKDLIVNELFTNQIGFYDSTIEGTKVRVNALFRIIRADKVRYALSQLEHSTLGVSIQAKDKAKETILKINSGELKLPNLED